MRHLAPDQRAGLSPGCCATADAAICLCLLAFQIREINLRKDKDPSPNSEGRVDKMPSLRGFCVSVRKNFLEGQRKPLWELTFMESSWDGGKGRHPLAFHSGRGPMPSHTERRQRGDPQPASRGGDLPSSLQRQGAPLANPLNCLMHSQGSLGRGLAKGPGRATAAPLLALCPRGAHSSET